MCAHSADMNPGMKRFALLENLYLVGSPPTRSIDVEIIAAAGSVRLAKIGRPRQLGNLFRAQGADDRRMGVGSRPFNPVTIK
jgi:hypothetical protein